METGKRNQTKKRSGKAGKNDSTAFKIKLRGKDNAPLSMQQLRQGLYDAARRLERYEGNYRAKWATIYLTMVDENGEEVQIDAAGEWTLYPYKSAAEEHGI